MSRNEKVLKTDVDKVLNAALNIAGEAISSLDRKLGEIQWILKCIEGKEIQIRSMRAKFLSFQKSHRKLLQIQYVFLGSELKYQNPPGPIPPVSILIDSFGGTDQDKEPQDNGDQSKNK